MNDAQRTAVAGAPDGASRGPGRPARLSRTLILRAALALIDEHGASALTMRRLGAELGVEAMSLYRHVRNKEAVIDGVAEVMMEDVDLTASDGDWTEVVRSYTNGIRSIAHNHPQAFCLVGLRPLNTVDSIRPIESLLAALREAGFKPATAVAAYRLLMSYARGYALLELSGFTLGEWRQGRSHLRGEQLPVAEFPIVNSLAAELSTGGADSEFRAGLEVVIVGLRATLNGSAGGPGLAPARP